MCHYRKSITWRLLASAALVLAVGTVASATELQVKGTRFTLDSRPTFLLGISYYAALGADEKVVQCDLDEMKSLGFNFIRVWATWAAFDNNVSAFDSHGLPREPYFSRLRNIVQQCNRRGMVVDITLTRGNRVVGEPVITNQKTHLRAVQTLLEQLREYRNWYLDLGNERNIKDRRHVPWDELVELARLCKKIDPKRLITASHAGDIPAEDLRRYVLEVQVDFISPHRPRRPSSPAETEEKTRQYLRQMRQLGRVIPVHYQEPFRRGFTKGWDPTEQDFYTDLRGAVRGGAAGWCFHNGDERHAPNAQPRRSFDMRLGPLFPRLDPTEKRVVENLHSVLLEAAR